MKRQSFILLALLPLLLAVQADRYAYGSTKDCHISTQAVINMMDSLMAIPYCDIHHVMIMQHGEVIAEMHPAPFRASDKHTVYSASKTFASMAVGIAIDEGLLHLDDKVVSFFPDKVPDTISDNLAAMTVRDLLTMTSGVEPDWAMRDTSTDWVKDWLAKTVADKPGTRFQYDSMCTFMLSAIVQRVTGRTLLDYLNEKLLVPMQCKDAEWEMSPDSINTGGWGLRVDTETMAKLGQLLLNKGNWKGRQLISAAYVEEACSRLNDGGADIAVPPTDGNQGYGYQVWQSKWPGSFRADGAFGQFSVVIPEYDLVVVIMGMTVLGHTELACIWDQLLPGIYTGPVQHDAELEKQLNRLCNEASLHKPEGEATGTGKNVTSRRLLMEENSYGLQWAQVDGDTLRFACKGRPVEAIPMGYGEWTYSTIKGYPPYSITAKNRMQNLNHDFVAGASYAWTTPSTIEIRIHYANWISGTAFLFDFDKQEAIVRDSYPRFEPVFIKFTVV